MRTGVSRADTLLGPSRSGPTDFYLKIPFLHPPQSNWAPEPLWGMKSNSYQFTCHLSFAIYTWEFHGRILYSEVCGTRGLKLRLFSTLKERYLQSTWIVKFLHHRQNWDLKSCGLNFNPSKLFLPSNYRSLPSTSQIETFLKSQSFRQFQNSRKY